jgi:hypothetical protein
VDAISQVTGVYPEVLWRGRQEGVQNITMVKFRGGFVMFSPGRLNLSTVDLGKKMFSD